MTSTRAGRRRRMRPGPGSLVAALTALIGLGAGWGGTLTSTAAASGALAGGTPTGGTLHVAMQAAAYQGFDPQESYTTAQWEVLSCCLQRTLMAFPGVAGYEGSRAVPDLATEPPSVSADGRTWTFHIRPGVHYSPPLQDVEVTARDIVRALERTRDADWGPGAYYLKPLLDGYAEFASGRSDSIAGVVVVDEHTLQLRETHPDRSIVDLMAMPFSAPIPPSPKGEDAPSGVATGHAFRLVESDPPRPPDNPGYGPFQSATGPYMIEGADQLDYSLPAGLQQVPSGFTPSWWGWSDDQPPPTGRLVLVRNPSWDPESDLNRPALPDRIEITIQPEPDPYSGLRAGTVDTVLGEDPSVEELSRYQTPVERARVHRSEVNGVNWVTLNLVQPPFDDLHVRRAFALALDLDALRRAKIAEQGPVTVGPVTSHVVPAALLDNLLAGSHPTGTRSADLRQARQEMSQSRYWADGHCVGSACKPVRIGGFDHPEELAVLAEAARAIGLRPAVTIWESGDTDCADPANKISACYWGWLVDYPNASGMFPPFLDGGDFTASGLSTPGTGASRADLRRVGLPVSRPPTVQLDYDRCASALPPQAALCWARLDRWLTSKVVAVVPTTAIQTVRLAGANVTEFSLDQAYSEPTLDRIAVSSSG